MTEYGRIRKECFWDYDISEKKIMDILDSSDKDARRFLFSKILLNSTNLLLDLQMFSHEELLLLFEELIVSQFNNEYINRRKNIAEAYFFDKPLEIDELKWLF